jgi:esterase/lipase
MKKEIKVKGIYNLKHGNYEYPITYQLIKDGKKNKILNKKIINRINVVMIHGSKDESVPVNYSKKTLKIFKNAEKKLLIIKNGDHSLSSKKNLKKITTELDNIISNSI